MPPMPLRDREDDFSVLIFSDINLHSGDSQGSGTSFLSKYPLNSYCPIFTHDCTICYVRA